MDEASHLARGIEAMARGEWEAARVHLEASLREEGPTAEASESLSWVAWSQNEAAEVFHHREDAFRQYRERNDACGAARMAMWLASDYLDFRGDVSIANGWRQRAHRLLEDRPLAPEHGWLAIIEGDAALMVDDDAPRARDFARRATAIARELGISDVEVLGQAMEGIALVTEGEVDAGMALLDEAAAAALAGEVTDPGYVSWALCYLIFACERVRDYDRAVEWCDRMREYAERSQLTIIRGICRVHYAGVLIWRGEWQAAEAELSTAASQLPSRPMLAADGTVRLAELRRRQGRFRESEELFRGVEWHPLSLIGLAELALEEGRPRDAEELIQRFLRRMPESSRMQRVGALELLVRIKAIVSDHAGARETLEAVSALSNRVATAPLRAASSFSAGALAAADGDFEAALACFEDALDLFERCGAPYESARTRLELAGTLVMLDRLERALNEVSTAYESLQRLASTFHAGRARVLRQDIEARLGLKRDSAAPGLLTERQVEILRLISKGLNDREIAAALVVSEHTVHRHVANVLQRLNLPSRAAAVAYATNNSII